MTLDLIHAELVRIREALEARPFASGAPAAKPAPARSDEVPLPTEIIADAGSVQVHFGKNKGVAIGSLTEKQLLWYGADREPQLKNDGTPFPPRAEDTLLKNACRTLWHARVAGTAVAYVAASAPTGSDEVPF